MVEQIVSQQPSTSLLIKRQYDLCHLASTGVDVSDGEEDKNCF